jgi:integrase
MKHQQHLWQDGHTVLKVVTGKIGKNRLARYLNWLDRSGENWMTPDLSSYARYLRDDLQLHIVTVYQSLSEVRNHYLAVLSNPDHYPHVPPEKRVEFVNRIVANLGYHTNILNYDNLVNGVPLNGSENRRVLLPPNASTLRETHLNAFVIWLDQTGRHWTNPSLLDYKEHLLKSDSVSKEAIGNVMTMLRKRYAEVLDDDRIMAELHPEQRERLLNDLRRHLGYLDQYPSKAIPNRDMLEDDPYNQNWLQPDQITALLSKPDASTRTGLRDRAMIALGVATGIQPAEVASVQIENLRQRHEGKLALYVPEGKQRLSRFIPYDEYEWVLDWMQEWLDAAEIDSGSVFRGTYGNRDVLRPNGIAPETASDILSRYPVLIHGHDVPLLFSDLRATCGRRWYDAGLDLDEIQRRLGIQYRRTVLLIIGTRVRDVFG